MPGRGPKIFRVEQKERLSFVPLAFSKLFNFDLSSGAQFKHCISCSRQIFSLLAVIHFL